jgi:hypothetical protein
MAKTISPFDEDRPEHVIDGMDAICRLVTAYAERLHGPMSQYRVEAYACESGEYLPTQTREGRQEICDGKRHFSGALARFFEAHWRIRRDLKDWYAFSPWQMPHLWTRYGWALCELHMEIPELNVVDPIDLEFEVEGDDA